MRKPIELVTGEIKFAKRLTAAEGDDRGKDERLDGRQSQAEAQRDEPAHRAAKIAAVEPDKGPCGRRDDEAQREERLDHRPTRHLAPRVDGRDQASTPKFNTAKPTEKVEFKAEADRKMLGVAIIVFEISRPSWRLLRLGGGTPRGEIGGPIVKMLDARGHVLLRATHRPHQRAGNCTSASVLRAARSGRRI
jgi:hypothetical protein